MVRKFGTNKTEVFHRMGLGQFTPQQTLPDVQITPQESKHDTEVNIKHDGLYAIAWECDYEKPSFHAKYYKTAPRNSPGNAVRSVIPIEDVWNTPRTP